MKRTLLAVFAGSVLFLGAGGLTHSGEKAGPPYGPNLMTQEEWREHHAAMRQLSAEERLAYRRRIHAEMKERARERGVELPDEMPDWAGHGMGPGHGMERGKGMGPGSGRRGGAY